MSPRRAAERAVLAHYQLAARHYSDRRDGGLAGRLRRREQAAVLELMAVVPGQRVLDVGCGDGAVAARLVKAGAWVVAVDLALPMAALARRRGALPVVADMSALPFRPDFERVACIGASEFAPSLDAVARELAGCLQPRGSAVLLLPRRNWLGLALWLYHRAHRVRIHLRSRAAVSASLVRAGLRAPEIWRRCAMAWVCRVGFDPGGAR